MKIQIITFIAEIAIVIAAVIFFKFFLHGDSSDTAKLNVIADWAYRFVVNAKNVLSSSSGEEKKEQVFTAIQSFADRYGIFLNDTEISALIEEAYDKIKSEKEVK